MRRERIEEIQRNGPRVVSYEEFEELCNIALRATDPDMVMVPREQAHEILRRAWNRDISADEGLEELEDQQ